jgi:ADP-L-glycero-D-manno-heptose 6-epimerase
MSSNLLKCLVMGTIVITGAAGMIGSGVVRYLNDRGFTQLLLIDDLNQSEKWKNLVGKEFLDLISRHQTFSYLQEHSSEITAIIHLGACSNTEETRGDYLLENNYRFSVRLAEWSLSRNKRFIYASSAATYGDGSRGFCDHEAEISQLRPLNMYAFSKHLFDLWMNKQGGFKHAVGLKYFNVFGPNEAHKGPMASLIYKMTPKVQSVGAIELYQYGTQQRDFIYVKDAVRMTCNFLDSSVSGLFNIGSGIPSTWNSLAGALFSAVGKPVQIHYIPMPPHLVKRYQNYTCADMRKYYAHFPVHVMPFEQAVFDYVQNHLMCDAHW